MFFSEEKAAQACGPGRPLVMGWGGVPVPDPRLGACKTETHPVVGSDKVGNREVTYLFWLTLVVVEPLDASCSRSFFIRLTSTRPPLMRFGFSSVPVVGIGALPIPTT